MKNLTPKNSATVKFNGMLAHFRKNYLLSGVVVATLAGCNPKATTEATATPNFYPLKPGRICLIADSIVNSTWQPVTDTSLLPAQITKRVLHLVLETITRKV